MRTVPAPANSLTWSPFDRDRVSGSTSPRAQLPYAPTQPRASPPRKDGGEARTTSPGTARRGTFDAGRASSLSPREWRTPSEQPKMRERRADRSRRRYRPTARVRGEVGAALPGPRCGSGVGPGGVRGGSLAPGGCGQAVRDPRRAGVRQDVGSLSMRRARAQGGEEEASRIVDAGLGMLCRAVESPSPATPAGKEQKCP